ncbi:hypothetical protein CSAL01_13717 [Colletotrichum salicis]|uniref:Uncharacterized protein n=1 Tax=Colletotrichum salicis TaxID=1209931 RepID=A0A135T872_9PEZI|nr:hypothetical protein CSAL01_13717 [Colletotrichum salicis]
MSRSSKKVDLLVSVQDLSSFAAEAAAAQSYINSELWKIHRGKVHTDNLRIHAHIPHYAHTNLNYPQPTASLPEAESRGRAQKGGKRGDLSASDAELGENGGVSAMWEIK